MRFLAFLSILLASGCAPTPDPSDAAPDAPSGACTSDDDCDDGDFCNGPEECVTLTGGARACAGGDPPCAADVCDPIARLCDDPCGAPDADGDGVASTDCGGDDCADDDVRRYPGNIEICDALGHDEDCDVATLGPDRDGDGAPGIECCNGLECGTDCDDARSGVNTGATEACNGLDDDCDLVIDETTQQTFYRDLDGDGFGVDDDTALDCSAPSGYAVLAGDCDPTLASIHPGAADGPTVACDGTDNDCSGEADEGCSCIDGTTAPCGPVEADGTPATRGICRAGVQTCIAGALGACVGSVDRGTETCEGSTDEDCDGMVDEGLTVRCYPDGDDDGYAVSTATARDLCPDPARTSVGRCPSNFTNRAPGTTPDCDDGSPARRPGLSELCATGIDEDCDGMRDEGCVCTTCTCSGASLSALTRLVLTDRTPAVDHAGYRWEWVGSTSGGLARIRVSCASAPSMVYAASYIAPASFMAPMVSGGAPHEIYMRTVSTGCCGATIELYIIRQ